jgi:hypothetical protein
MKKILILLSLLIIAISINAEKDPIRNEIANYNLSGRQSLDKAHHLMIDNLNVCNFTKVDSISRYLEKYYTDAQIYGNDKYKFFSYLVCHRMDDLSKIRIEADGYGYYGRSYTDIGNAKLNEILTTLIKQNFQELNSDIDAFGFDESKSSYLKLKLMYCLYGVNDQFNQKATIFIDNNLNTDFCKEVRKWRKIYAISNTGYKLGATFNYSTFNGNLSKSLNSGIGMGLLIDAVTKSVSLHLVFDVVELKLKKDIGESSAWNDNKNVSLLKYGFGAGYPIQIIEPLIITPFTCISSMELNSSNNDGNMKQISLAPSFSFGANIDILVYRSKHNNLYLHIFYDHLVRIQLYYQNPYWQNVDNQFDGGSISLSIGYSYFSNFMDRVE